MCIARGQSHSFNKNNVKIEVSNEKEALLTYLPHEELISNVVDLKSTNGNNELKDPIYVAIPHVMGRSTAVSREPVVKAMMDGEWVDLPTQDVTFDTHKETKFAQAEVHYLTSLVVMSRFKRDYVTMEPKIAHKLTSSCDQRVTFTVAAETFITREHFMLQVE
ncbi:Death domain-containing protein 1-like [Plakobranchus ocellatus]|uniref:Death domain-containing protein 1-like n=1 Tax=Plakobranchus ocellatus TaxID=259542 RepID=A0AAV3YA11_9GAST|nr:Death domain-containing protein 1-like [Plakobranchus ocellatus]